VQKRIDQRFGELEKLLANDSAAQAALQQVQAARRAYEPLQNETQELAGSGQVFDAKDLLVAKMHPAQQAYFSAMDALLLQQQQQLGQATGATERLPTACAACCWPPRWWSWCSGACWPGGSFVPSPTLRQAVRVARSVAAGNLRSPLRRRGATRWRSCCWP
jgi:methyl-accepting chemotaxis protein